MAGLIQVGVQCVAWNGFSAGGKERRCSRKIEMAMAPKPSQGTGDWSQVFKVSRRSGRAIREQLEFKLGALVRQIGRRNLLLDNKDDGDRQRVLLLGPGKSSTFQREDEVGDLPLEYNPEAIALFFQRRPGEVIARVMGVASQCSYFVLCIVLDKSFGKLRQNERLRAAELVKLITRLGPTAIKIGQALSIRPDMISLEYLEQLQKLQDRVPPFSNEVAMQMIQQQIGENIFSEISSEPVAAGSLGQVYKARLVNTGDAVAVKVQRPGVLRTISCDLFILRKAACILHRLFRLEANFIEFLDSWAARFFNELDYLKEAGNSQRFSKDMASVDMIDIPEVYREYTSHQVLTTKWVNGEKLSDIKDTNILPLVNSALTCYLIQLLESGFLHADPHPGNLLRTPDGRLCILDYGLMTEVTKDQQLAMIEFLVHVVNSDYAALAEDLVRLGFLPAQSDSQETPAIVPEVTRIFTELVRGGGARKINMKEIADGLTKISREYTLVIPPYFSLIIRAFTLLEGIGLDIDPDYAIMRECYPYVAKRLVTDDSKRMRQVLKYFLYTNANQLNVKRVEQVMSSFQDFQQLMSLDKGFSRNDTTRQALLMVLDPKGSFVQELLLAEFVRVADALSRTARFQLWQFFASVLNLPIPSSVPVLFRISEDDRNSLQTLQQLWPLLQPYVFSPESGTELAKLSRQILPLVPDLFPGAYIFTQKFILMLLQRQALRYADDLVGKDTAVTRWNEDPSAFIRKIPWVTGV